jgi:hypothetical protein
LTLKCDEPLSNFAVNSNLRRYTEVDFAPTLHAGEGGALCKRVLNVIEEVKRRAANGSGASFCPPPHRDALP